MTVLTREADYARRTIRFGLADAGVLEGDRGEVFVPANLTVILEQEGDGAPWFLHSAVIDGQLIKRDGKLGRTLVKRRLTAPGAGLAPGHAPIRDNAPDWARDEVARVLRSVAR